MKLSYTPDRVLLSGDFKQFNNRPKRRDVNIMNTLDGWKDDSQKLIEESIRQFYTDNHIPINERNKVGRGEGSDSFFHRSCKPVKFLGKRCILKVYKTTRTNIPKDRLERVDTVITNIISESLWKYLVKSYNESGDTPTLSDIGIKDHIALMRQINMLTAILQVNYSGDVYLLANFIDNKHSITVSFPHGTFIRKRKKHTTKYAQCYGHESPTYTFMEIYDDPHNFNDLKGSHEI